MLVVTILNFSVFGEFPHKHHIFISGLSGYVIYEIVDQELNGWDTVEDIVFFGIYGVGGTLITASEITPGNPIAVVDVMALGAVFLVGFCHLSFGSLLRWLDARRS